MQPEDASNAPEIQGWCDERFEGVRRAMDGNFRQHGEVGASVAVTLDGVPVVDLWAGWADLARTRPWERDTLVNVFSVGKAMVSLAVLMLVDRGQVDTEAPVAAYWPEFAAAGKAKVTVGMLLSHQAGLPGVRRLLEPGAMYDWELMTTVLAEEEPWWEPGSQHGYHVNTLGFLAGEIVRRVSGASIGAFFRQEVADRLGADFHFGIGPEYDHRVAEFLMEGLGGLGPELDDEDERQWVLRRLYFNPPGLSGHGTVNTRAWRAAEYPSTSGHANARAIARIYSALACGGAVDGVRLLYPDTLAAAVTEAASGEDVVLERRSRFGLGFQLTQPERPLGPNPRSFGHFGAGGSLGFADPDAGIAFGYAMNKFGPRWRNPCNRALIDAVYEAV